jgi:site-specific DNA recombinase
MITSSPDPAQGHDEAGTTMRALAALSPDFTPPESYSVPPTALRCILDILVGPQANTPRRRRSRTVAVRFAFYGRVSTEDAQDPAASRAWQLHRATGLIAGTGAQVVAEYFDIGQSRSLPWKRRPEASRLLADLADPDRGWEAVVIGEPARAFYGGQFGLTFPLFTDYRVALWVPEVGGAIDPGSEAHDLVMTLFGGLSKGERTRIKIRVRSAMEAMAADGSRFLGGRPPYGYQLVDAGPHPNPSKATAGQRVHRLEPDPVTAPIARRMFAMYADGAGLRLIADTLTREGVPSPAAYDRQRNLHRDPRGWAHTAVRAILDLRRAQGVGEAAAP